MANAKDPRTGGSNDDHDDNTTTSNNNARSETDPAEASARGKLRDLGVLCGEKNTCPPDTELSTGRGVVLYRKHTEVTEALGGLAPHTAGLRVRYNLCRDEPRRRRTRRRRRRTQKLQRLLSFSASFCDRLRVLRLLAVRASRARDSVVEETPDRPTRNPPRAEGSFLPQRTQRSRRR